ncbi:hypothetical protein [Rhodococcus sp. HNM0569]|uniref:hypothetical protein n=1 Tax=Rhodococcus sp. HNM0569 TaxID=2716340 RepID=UPI00146AE39D|nr:hypothetical protein [Rhodococcus sp. HNM0569]NLU83233.1 hypothetical protein [Rhodococcus sp. HNM0569]
MSAVAVMATAGHASAAPTTSQPGVTSPSSPGTSQPGVTSPSSPSTSQPGVTTTQDWEYVPGFDPGAYRNVETQQDPDSVLVETVTPAPAPQPQAAQEVYYYYDEGDYSGEQAEQPVVEQPAVEQDASLTENGLVKPIQAEEGKVRLGMVKADRPTWMTEQQGNQVNNTSAVLEAQGATFFNSLGVPTNRAQRVAAGTTAGVVIGATTGAVVLGAPFALVGAGVGAAAGAGVMSIPVVGEVACLPYAMVGCIGIGAGIGAAAGRVPAAVVGGAIGGTIGGVIGGAYGAGQNVGEVAPEESFDKGPLTNKAREVVSQVEAMPGGQGVVNAARGTSDAFQSALWDGRNAIAAQPNGDGMLAQIDAADEAAKALLDPAHAAADAIGQGLQPAPAPAPAVA